MPAATRAAITPEARDAGLVRGIGPGALTAVFVGILIGSGIFTVPAVMAAAVGAWAPLAYLGCAFAVGAVMICFAEATSRVPTSGGVSGFVAAAFGPYWGFLTGMLNWASAAVAAGGIGAASADVIGTVVPALAAGPVRAIAIAGWFLTLAVINTTGVGIAARFVTIVTSLKVVPLAVFVGVGVWFIDPALLTLPLANVSGPGGGHADIGRAAIVGIFLFMGIETSLAVSGEVRDPARTIPRAVMAALFGYAALCIAIQLVAQGLLGAALGTSVAPLADAIGQVSPALRAGLVAGTAVSMLGWTASDAISAPRMLFALSRDGFLPALLGRIHRRTHAPWIACLAHAAIAAGLAISGSFIVLVVLSTLLAVMVYLIGSAAALKLRADDIAHAGPPVRIPALPLIASIGVSAMIWVACQSTRQEAIAIVVFIAATSLIYSFRRRPGPAPAAVD